MPLKRRWKPGRTTSNLDTWNPAPVEQPPQQSTRRYLAETAYLLPKDDAEGVRLHFQHHALFQVLGNHYVAPLDPAVRTILDVGTGTGIWAQAMAQVFPQALVVGLDLDPALLRETPTLPANCLLRVGDVCKGLPFPDRFFSYTHQRLLVYAIPAAQWPAVVRELVRVTLPGGWVECVEADPVLHNQGPATRQFLTAIAAVQRAGGIHPEPIRQLGSLFEQAGLQRIEVQTIPLALGEWGGRIGVLLKQNALSVFGALKEPCCRQHLLTSPTFDALLSQMNQEWETFRTSCICSVVFGRRRLLCKK